MGATREDLIAAAKRKEVKAVWLDILKTAIRSGQGYMTAMETADKCTERFKRDFS